MDINTLKKFIPFAGLQDDYLEEAIGLIDVVTYNKGHILFKRGREYDIQYFLVDGRVDLIDSQFNVTMVRSASDASKTRLNAHSPTHFSGVVKEKNAVIFSLKTEALDRLVAWSESAESAFESESQSKRNNGVGESLSLSDSTFHVSEVSSATATDWMSSLLQSPLFTRIPLTYVQELFTRFETVEASAGEVIIKEGERGDYFYVLAQGKAHITNRLESVDLMVDPGKHFGEEALLGSTLRNATITMLEDGVLKRLDHEAFSSLLTQPVLRYVEQKELDTLSQPYKLLDVRMPMEYRMGNFDESINVPLPRLRKQLPELGKTCIYAVPDNAGSRADIAVYLLCQAGFEAVILKSEAAQSESNDDDEASPAKT